MPDILPIDLVHISDQVGRLNITEALQAFAGNYPGQVIFSSSFSMEDQLITDIILCNKISITIFTLDTGRLFPETYAAWSSTNEKYAAKINGYFPDHHLLENYLTTKGPNAFYESTENRRECCYIRKVEPLKRALAGHAVWVTGLRAEHSPERSNLPLVEWDGGNEVIKYNPLMHWTTQQVKDYISKNNVPYNSLQDRGFVSIGCAPCTRAIRPGEDFRAGRWWWEDKDKKECGLHVHEDNLLNETVELPVRSY